MPRERKLPAGMWKRGQVYFARFRAGGREVRKRLSTDFRVANELLNELRARADRADFGLVDNDFSWDELKSLFLKSKQQTSRRPDCYRVDLGMFEQFCRVKTVRQVTPEYVIGFREWRLAQGVSARTVNRQVGVLSHMLNWACGKQRGRSRGSGHKLIASNPIADVAPLPEDVKTKTRRSLNAEEVRSLLAASPEYLRPVWRMFMLTGLRRQELVGLRFEDVDFDRGCVKISAARSKNRRSREIPLDDEMLATIRHLKVIAPDRQPKLGSTAELTRRQAKSFSTSHIFVTTANTPWRNNLLRSFYSVCRRAGIEGGYKNGTVDIHSLRVSFATLSMENGASPKAVQAILGHSTLKMTMDVYTRATESAKLDAIRALPFASFRGREQTANLTQDAPATGIDEKCAQTGAKS